MTRRKVMTGFIRAIPNILGLLNCMRHWCLPCLLCQPPAKRACTAGPLEAALQVAEGALDTLEELLAMGPAPGWLPAQLRVLLRRIEVLNRLSEDPHEPQRNHGGPTSSTEETSLGSGL